jgi:hypothetical protein
MTTKPWSNPKFLCDFCDEPLTKMQVKQWRRAIRKRNQTKKYCTNACSNRARAAPREEQENP